MTKSVDLFINEWRNHANRIIFVGVWCKIWFIKFDTWKRNWIDTVDQSLHFGKLIIPNLVKGFSSCSVWYRVTCIWVKESYELGKTDRSKMPNTAKNILHLKTEMIRLSYSFKYQSIFLSLCLCLSPSLSLFLKFLIHKNKTFQLPNKQLCIFYFIFTFRQHFLKSLNHVNIENKTHIHSHRVNESLKNSHDSAWLYVSLITGDSG